MVGSISRIGSAPPMQSWRSNRVSPTIVPPDPKSHTRSNQIGGSQSQYDAGLTGILRNHGFIDRNTPRSEMIRAFLGMDISGTPKTDMNIKSEGLCSATYKTTQEVLKTAMKANGFIDRNTPRSDMIKLTMGLGPYENIRASSNLSMSAVARISEFCRNLIQAEEEKAIKSQSGIGLDISM